MFLPNYNNKTPVTLKSKELTQCNTCIDKLIDSLSFFKVRLNDRPNRTDVHTHMNLFESYFKELASLTDYQSIMTEDLNTRNQALRNANMEIQRLNDLLSETISPEAVSAALRKYDNIIRLFYGAIGFHYASLKEYTSYGIIYEFSDEMELQPDDGHSIMKHLSEQFQKELPFIVTTDSDYDIYFDTYHAEMLDTNNNRKKLTTLFTTYFPNCLITEFRSRRNDYESFSLRFTIRIPYRDIENLLTT